MTSGGDTRIIGSTVKGNRIDAHIAGELEITSLQDTNEYHNTQESQGVNVGYNFGTGVGSLGYNDSIGTVDGDQASVTTQAGFYAGSEGLNLQVAGTTTLTGGVISSEASADKNHFSTGGLVHTDLENHAQWEADQSGTNISLSTNAGSLFSQAALNSIGVLSPGLDDNHSATGISHATITENIQVDITQPTSDGADPLEGLNRDAALINTGSVEQDVQGMMESQERMQVQQQNAQAFSKLGTSVVGDVADRLGLPESSPVRVALHAAVGAVSASLADGDVVVGAAVGAINEVVTNHVIAALIDAHPIGDLSNMTPEEIEQYLEQREQTIRNYAIAASGALGLVVGAIGGGNNSATLGQISASNATQHNALEHTDFYGAEISLITAISVCKNGYSQTCQELQDHFERRSDRIKAIIEKACQSGDTQACANAMGGIVEAWRRGSSSVQYGMNILIRCNGDAACVDIYVQHMRENVELINKYYATAFPNGEKGLRDIVVRYGFASAEEAATLSYADLIATYNENVTATLGVTQGMDRGIPRVGRPNLNNPPKLPSFSSRSRLRDHFSRHGSEFNAKNAAEYLAIAREIISKGYSFRYQYKGSFRTGYAMYFGQSRKGHAKFAFVGTNEKGNITTLHIQTGKDFWRTINGSTGDRTIRP